MQTRINKNQPPRVRRRSGKNTTKLTKSNFKTKNNKRKSIVSKEKLPLAAQLLLNPCTSKLVEGFHSTSEGILSRFHTTQDLAPNYVNGYVVWCPHYVSNTGHPTETCFVFEDPNPATTPLNTVANPYGTLADPSTANAVRVGASAFVSSETCADFRLLSACMKLSYTGSMTAAAGLVVPIQNVSFETIMLGNGLGGPVSINQLFNLCAGAKRLSLETIELRHRPDAALVDGFKEDTDAPINKGVAATNASTLSNEAKRFSPTVIGFAWKGVPAGSLVASFTQNIEWRPEAASGITAMPAVQLHEPGYTAKILRMLDDYLPSWQTASMSAASSAASSLVRSIFAPSDLYIR